MFRKMRRKRQQLTEAECIDILMENTSGVLAVCGDNGYPYAVPLSYVYDNGSLYFHCARSGHKLDAIKTCDVWLIKTLLFHRNILHIFGA